MAKAIPIYSGAPTLSEVSVSPHLLALSTDISIHLLSHLAILLVLPIPDPESPISLLVPSPTQFLPYICLL